MSKSASEDVRVKLVELRWKFLLALAGYAVSSSAIVAGDHYLDTPLPLTLLSLKSIGFKFL